MALGKRLLATLGVLLLSAIMLRLGLWQLSRFEHRRATAALVQRNLAEPPVPVDELTAPGRPPERADTWRRVTAVGRYDASRQLLARNRALGGRLGYEVLTPLLTASGSGLLVNRGWVPAGRSAIEAPPVPPPPSGSVRVTGRLRPAEVTGAQGRRSDAAPAGQVIRIEPQRIAGELPYPLYGGWIELTAEAPAAQPAPLPVPAPDPGLGPHLAYAFQWWLFALLAPVGWGYLWWRDAATEGRTARDARTDRGVRAAR